MKSPRRWLRAVALTAFGVALVALLASLLADEPVRRLLERRMNERLRDYRVEMAELDLRPFALGVAVRDLVVVRGDEPHPPLVHVNGLGASLDLRALLRGAVVLDVTVERPALYIDRVRAQREARDEVPLVDKGWQDAVQAVTPLKINEVRVHDGAATYVEEGAEPLRLTGIRARASNIRNIHSRDREYPSDFTLDATVFETGALQLRGHADFLAKPLPGVSGEVTLEGVALDHFQPILERHHFAVRGGTLALSGEAELGRTVRRLHLRELLLDGLRGEYVRTPASAAKEPAVARQAARAAREATQDPELRLHADRIELRNAEVGMVNRTAAGPYRVFSSHTTLELENFSNRFGEGTGTARFQGRFMGSGRTDATATFRSERTGPDFDLEVRIVDTPLSALNELLRAYGKFDASSGFFSLYSEVRVEAGRVEGYVKPLFRDVQIHDPAQDQRDGLARKAYESVVGGLAGLFENQRDEVATQTDLSGPVEDPKASTFELLVKLVQNAFFEAILPGFDHEAGRPRG
jgi:Domain of Unknown Function (DUF748)